MLHHYNYSTSLSHFFTSYHQLEDQQLMAEIDPNSNNSSNLCDEFSGNLDDDSQQRYRNSSLASKSFTIAAILGLKNDRGVGIEPTTAVNLSTGVHLQRSDGDDRILGSSGCNGRLPQQIPRHGNGSTALAQYSEQLGCVQRQPTVRALKHLSSTSTMQKKNCKSKRVRTIFTPEQLERLEAEFERQQYMVGPERLYLAHTLQLTEAQVKVWFQNRRIKWRKHHLELTHQRLAVLKQQQLLLDDTQPEIHDTNSSSTDTT